MDKTEQTSQSQHNDDEQLPIFIVSAVDLNFIQEQPIQHSLYIEV